MEKNIREWLICTVRKFEESPQNWPVRKEMVMEGELFWAYLEVYSFMDYTKGKEKWDYRIGVHRGPEAQTEMYFSLIGGSKEDILQYMKEQLQKRCEKEISFLSDLIRRLNEKDDDFYDDFW